MTRTSALLLSILALAACSRTGASSASTATTGGTSATTPAASPDGPRTDMAYDPSKPMAGVWSSDEGLMRLAQDGDHVSGAFDHSNGRLDGAFAQGRFDGFWMQDTSSQECPTERAGTRYWGHARFTPTSDGRRFAGLWSYCDDAMDREWGGQRGQPG